METSEEAIFQQIKGIFVTQLDLEDWEMTGNTRIMEDLQADSKAQSKLLAAIEKKFQIVLPKEEILLLQTVNDWIQAVRRHQLRDID